MSQKLVDIIIPIHNRPEHTKQTLQSLFKNTDPDLYNLYLINDGSGEEIAELLFSDWMLEAVTEMNPPPIVLTNAIAAGPAASRNRVTKNITEANNRSKYLYHSDNDVYFKEGWLETINEFYERLLLVGSIALIGGGCHPYLQNNDTIPLYKNDGSLSEYKLGIKDAVSGYSQFMKWEVWDKYGPFDEGQGGQEKKIMGSEDWAFCQRIIADKYFVGSLEPEVVIHTGKTNTYGENATGVETFKDLEGIMIK